MLQRLVTFALVAAAAYWYWQGPYQSRTHPDYASSLDHNDAIIASCVKGMLYRAGTTGVGPDVQAAQDDCARENNLYDYNGRWHSYARERPN